MSDGNIRSAALTWFDSTHPSIKEPILASKFYTRDESWSKTKVWFFQVPLEYVEPNKIKYLHFLCENHLNRRQFYISENTDSLFAEKRKIF